LIWIFSSGSGECQFAHRQPETQHTLAMALFLQVSRPGVQQIVKRNDPE
jgi:hypothetical protein